MPDYLAPKTEDHLDTPSVGTFMATCQRCGGKYGHPGPCPNCCPSNAFNINTAFRAGFNAHDMQFRRGRATNGKNGPLYFVHICEIMGLLWEWGYDIDTHSGIHEVACLHDAVEDKGTTYEAIATTPGLGTTLSRRTRQMTFDGGDKNAYLETFIDPTLTDVECLITKIADRICNVRNELVTDRDKPIKSRRAAAYLKKGEPIFKGMVIRRTEIIEIAGRASSPYPEVRTEKGVKIYRRMQTSVDEIYQRCALSETTDML